MAYKMPLGGGIHRTSSSSACRRSAPPRTSISSWNAFT